jgi:hypothetical protein
MKLSQMRIFTRRAMLMINEIDPSAYTAYPKFVQKEYSILSLILNSRTHPHLTQKFAVVDIG